MRLITCLILGCLVSGCADYRSSDNPTQQTCQESASTKCELLMCKYDVWVADACVAWDECCFCECWTDDHRVPDFDENGCVCMDGDPLPEEYFECRGETLWEVERCLQDEPECRGEIERSINDLCEFW